MTQWAGRGGRRGRRPLPRPCLPPSTSLRTRFVFVFVLLNQCLKEKTIIFEDRIWANYLPELCTLKCTILHKLTDHNISTSVSFLICCTCANMARSSLCHKWNCSQLSKTILTVELYFLSIESPLSPGISRDSNSNWFWNFASTSIQSGLH